MNIISLKVEFVFPQQSEKQIKHICSYGEFEQAVDKWMRKYDYKIIAFLREDQKYYNLKKYQQKVKSIFAEVRSEGKSWKNQQLQIPTVSGSMIKNEGSQIKVSTSGIRPSRRQSECKMLEILVEFKYKPEYWISQRVGRIKQSIQSIQQELSKRIKKAEEPTTIYTKLRMEGRRESKKNNALMKDLKIWILISQPLVKQPEKQKPQNQPSPNNNHHDHDHDYNHHNNQGHPQRIPILHEQIKIGEHIEILKNLHSTKNNSINLQIQSLYISWQRICELVKRLSMTSEQRQEEAQQRQQLQQQQNKDKKQCSHLLHVYVEVYEKDGEYYVVLENEKDVGMANCSIAVSKLMAKLNQIPNLLTVILIGPKTKLLPRKPKKQKSKQPQNLQLYQCTQQSKQRQKSKEKQKERQKEKSKERQKDKDKEKEKLDWFKLINVPIITVNLFDNEKDNGRKLFMQYFYSSLFSRKTVSQAYQSAHEHMKSKDFSMEMADCCCVHWYTNKYQIWGQMEDRIGATTLHKLFIHKCMSQSQHMDERFRMELFSFILNRQAKSINQKETQCQVKHKRNRWQKTLNNMMIVNQDRQKKGWLIANPQQMIEWEPGEYVNNKPSPKIQPFFRPDVLYDFIQLIIKSQKFHVLTITGSSKSGKSKFIERAQNYLANRYKQFVFVTFYEWIQCFRSGKAVYTIHAMVKKIQKQKESIKQQDGLRKLKVIINVGKINYDVKEQYQHFIEQVSQNSEIKQQNILILSALGETQRILNQKIQKIISIYTIPQISAKQVQYFVLKNESISQLNIKCIHILKVVIQALKNVQDQNIKNQLDFSRFCKHIKEIMATISKQSFNQQQIKNIITDQIQQYNIKTKVILNELRECDVGLWEIIGFLCSFKEGFFICDFNLDIVCQGRNGLDDVIRKEEETGCLFRKYQHAKLINKKQAKCFSIQPDKKCFQYFQENRRLFFQRKIRYFFHLYSYVYHLCKQNPKDFFCRKHWRVFNNLGIFMYELPPHLHLHPITPQILQKCLSKQTTSDQRSYIYEIVLEKHIYSFIQILKQINQINMSTMAIDEKQIVVVTHTILFVSLLYQGMDDRLGGKISQFRRETCRFMGGMKRCIGNQSISVMFVQICSLLDQHNISKYLPATTPITSTLTSLHFYQQTVSHIETSPKLFGLCQSTAEQIREQIEGHLLNIGKSIQLLQLNIVNGNMDKQKISKHNECMLILAIIKTMLKYKFCNDDQDHPQLNTHKLLHQLQSLMPISHLCQQSRIRSNICIAYLKTKINIHNCHDSDLPITQTNTLPIQFQQLYHYIKQKLNPKLLFKSSNIALFMKSSCLQYRSTDYNFVRMNNIISNFLSQYLSSRCLNLLFLNLSHRNFEMVCTQRPLITYFVISADTVIDKNGNFSVIFQDNYNVSAREITIKEFIQRLKLIKIKILIIFGAKSQQLGRKISGQLSKENICVICLSLKKKFHPQLNLSSFPQIQNAQLKKDWFSYSQIVQGFLKAENCQRMMQLTICCLIALLANEKDKLTTQENLNEMINIAKGMSMQVIKKWYKVEFNNQSKLFQDILPDIQHSIYLKSEHSYLPFIQPGQLKNITREIIATPHNFNDDSYYENVGRVSELQEIMLKLSCPKSVIIEISGGKKSGKTELLKQIGWFCQTRRVFPLGVYFYDVQKLTKQEKVSTVLQHINKQYISKQYLLILLDNFQQKYICSNRDIFQNFFDQLSKKRISFVYTVRQDPKKKKTNKKSSDFWNEQVYEFVKSMKKGTKKQDQPLKKNINIVDDVEKICIALTKIRHRGSLSYQQQIQKIFPQYCRLRLTIRNKSSYRSKQGNESNNIKKTTQTKSKNKEKQKQFLYRQKSAVEEAYQVPNEITRKYTLGNLRSKNSLSNDDEQQQQDSSFHQMEDTRSREMSQDMYEICQESEEEADSNNNTPTGLVRGMTSTSSTHRRQAQKSDMYEVVDECEKYKKQGQSNGERRTDEQNKFEESYLKFDVETLRDLLEKRNGVKITIVNNMYFENWSVDREDKDHKKIERLFKH